MRFSIVKQGYLYYLSIHLAVFKTGFRSREGMPPEESAFAVIGVKYPPRPTLQIVTLC